MAFDLHHLPQRTAHNRQILSTFHNFCDQDFFVYATLDLAAFVNFAEELFIQAQTGGKEAAMQYLLQNREKRQALDMSFIHTDDRFSVIKRY